MHLWVQKRGCDSAARQTPAAAPQSRITSADPATAPLYCSQQGEPEHQAERRWTYYHSPMSNNQRQNVHMKEIYSPELYSIEQIDLCDFSSTDNVSHSHQCAGDELTGTLLCGVQDGGEQYSQLGQKQEQRSRCDFIIHQLLITVCVLPGHRV